MVSEEIIKEAAKRGIVPGARIKCASGNGEDVVPPIEEWVQEISGSFHWGKNNTLWRWGKFRGDWATVITPAPSSDTLKPGMATACGPAMRAAIMERAKKLGLMDPSSKEKDTTEGIWVLDFGLQKGMLHTCTIVNSMGLTLIPAHEFLHLMENTKPPVKELTTEEKLAEAISVIREAEAGLGFFVGAITKDPAPGFIPTPEKALRIIYAFLKSIEP